MTIAAPVKKRNRQPRQVQARVCIRNVRITIEQMMRMQLLETDFRRLFSAVQLWNNCRDAEMGRRQGRLSMTWMEAADNLQRVFKEVKRDALDR